MTITGDSLRESVDDLLKELAVTHKIPRVPDYKFIDKNGWPVLRSQEEKLSLLDLMSCQTQVRIQFRNTSEGKCLSPGLSHSMSGSPRLLQAIEDGDGNNSQRRRNPSNVGLPPISSVMPSMMTTADTVDSRLVLPSSAEAQISIREVMQEDTWKRRGSKKSSLSRKFSSRKMDKTIKIKSDSDSKKKHCVMLSYARNEAAQHALVLKQELDKLGISTYLDVHEITSGSDWMDSLNSAVNNCFIFVPLVTPLYGNTQWTNREVKLADLLSKKIVPINFLDSWPPECLAIQFATTQYITWIPTDTEVDKNQLDGFKIWPAVCIKKIAKMLAAEVPKDWNKVNKAVSFSGSTFVPSAVTSVLPSIMNGKVNDSIVGDRSSVMTSSNSSLVVISGHPSDISVVNRIKYSLESEGYTVWCSCDDRMGLSVTPTVDDPNGPAMIDEEEGEDQIDRIPLPPSATSCLPTINEGQSLESNAGAFTDAYKEMARSLVASKQRPTSLPGPSVCQTVLSSGRPNIQSQSSSSSQPIPESNNSSKGFQSMSEVAVKRRTPFKRTLSDVGALSSLTPDKRERLAKFASKVAESSLVIVLSSKKYFESATSKEQVYYCETRKKMIVVKADDYKSPPWFDKLMAIQLEVVSIFMYF